LTRDGTQVVEPGFIEVSAGRGTIDAQLFIIGANLTAGDKAYPLSDSAAVEAGAGAANFTITETVTRTYLGTSKTVDHYAETIANATTGDYVTRNAYYDKETGVLLEMTIAHYFADVGQIDSEHWKIAQFNSAVLPSDGANDGTDGTNSNGSLSWWLVPVAIVVVTVVVVVLAAMIVLRRRRKAEVQEPSQMPSTSSPETPV
jgi:hypothetical protein